MGDLKSVMPSAFRTRNFFIIIAPILKEKQKNQRLHNRIENVK